MAIDGSAAPTTSSSLDAANSSVFQWQDSEPSTAMAERPRTRRASLVAISRLAPLRNSVTSPVERATSAASKGASSKPAQYLRKMAACFLSAPSRITTAPSPADWWRRQSVQSAARHTDTALSKRSLSRDLAASNPPTEAVYQPQHLNLF